MNPEAQPVNRQSQHTLRRWVNYFKTIFLFLYFITWALGVPSMYSDVAQAPLDTAQLNYKFTEEEFASWRSMLRNNATPEDIQNLVNQIGAIARHPRAVAHFEFAIPLAPCVILSKHDSLWGGLAGRAGLFLYFWPFKKEIRLWGWMS